jgi:L-amino acid N-acyltransferase YncA
VYVHERVRNRGVGRNLYTALFHLLRRQGFFNAYAGITLPNPASVRLHESMGFSPVGVYSRVGYKLGNWHDVIWLQLRLAEGPEPSDDPRSIDGVLEDKAILAFLDECAQSIKLD